MTPAPKAVLYECSDLESSPIGHAQSDDELIVTKGRINPLNQSLQSLSLSPPQFSPIIIKTKHEIRAPNNLNNNLNNNKNDQEPSLRSVPTFSAKVVLEVFGGGGAFWGFSEVLTLRSTTAPQESWRSMAQIIAAVFFLRLVSNLMDECWEKDNNNDNNEDKKKTAYISLIPLFLARMNLEVFGAAGAIWGFTEVCTIRNPITQELWRCLSLVVGVIFFIRFILRQIDFIKKEVLPNTDDERPPSSTQDEVASITRFSQIFAAKLILEVFGSVGAVWGFADIITIRTESNERFWRYSALAVGFVFFIRFVLQIDAYLSEATRSMILRRQQRSAVAIAVGGDESTPITVVAEGGYGSTATEAIPLV